MASLDDILTTAKNLVSAINGLGQTYLGVNGSKTSAAIPASTPTLVMSGQGRLVNVSVTNPSGTASGVIYDCTSTTTLTRPIGAILPTQGVYVWNIPVSYGIVVDGGTGMTVVVTYSN